eukprot:scaffold108273_cov60-Phaeocystis_antarctica.AAC.5
MARRTVPATTARAETTRASGARRPTRAAPRSRGRRLRLRAEPTADRPAQRPCHSVGRYFSIPPAGNGKWKCEHRKVRRNAKAEKADYRVALRLAASKNRRTSAHGSLSTDCFGTIPAG